jgi:UDP-glucose 4-epimerase
MKYKKILITGGAGFIGTNLTDYLLKKYPDINIVIYDNFSNNYKYFIKKFFKEISLNKIKILNYDLLNKKKLLSAMKKIDLVFHLAANSNISLAIKNPLIDFNGTLITSNLLECCRVNKVKKIMYTSGSGIYGDNKRVNVENNITNIKPISFYGASKLSCESLMSAYSHIYNMDISVFRMANIIGKYSTHGVIFDLLRKIKKNSSKLIILGNGKQNKSYLHVKDLINAFFYVLKKQKKKYDIFNVATDELITVTNISKIVFKIIKKNPKIIYTGGKIGWKGDVSYIKLCNKKIKKLGWKYSLKTSEAVRKTIVENYEIYSKKVK